MIDGDDAAGGFSDPCDVIFDASGMAGVIGDELNFADFLNLAAITEAFVCRERRCNAVVLDADDAGKPDGGCDILSICAAAERGLNDVNHAGCFAERHGTAAIFVGRSDVVSECGGIDEAFFGDPCDIGAVGERFIKSGGADAGVVNDDFCPVFQAFPNVIGERIDDIVEIFIDVEVIFLDVIEQEISRSMLLVCAVGFIDFTDEKIGIGDEQRRLTASDGNGSENVADSVAGGI